MKRTMILVVAMNLALASKAVEYTSAVSLTGDVTCETLTLGPACLLDLNGHNLTYDGNAAGLVFTAGAIITNSSATVSAVSITSSNRISDQFKKVVFGGNLSLHVKAQTSDNAGFQGVTNTHTGGTTLENFNDSNDAKRARFNTDSPFGTGVLTLKNTTLRSTHSGSTWTLANSEIVVKGTGNYLANDNAELCLNAVTLEDGAELEIAGNSSLNLKNATVTAGNGTKVHVHSGRSLHLPDADYSGMELQLATSLTSVYFWGAGGDIDLGALSTADDVTEEGAYKVLNSTYGERILRVGALNRSTTFYGNIGKDTGTWNLMKVGTGTLTLGGINGNTGKTTISNGVLKLVGNGSVAASSAIEFKGGTLAYGDGVTTDCSAKVSGATESISVDTGTNTIVWADSHLTSYNPNVKGITKLGDGELCFSSYDDLVLAVLKSEAYTNRIEGGTLTLRNSRRGQRPDLKSKILGTGTLRLAAFEDNGGFRLRGNGALEEFGGVLEWAETNFQDGAVGFMCNNGNLNMPNVRFRLTGDPNAATVVMKGETGTGRTVTVGAFDHLHPNAQLQMQGEWNLNINGNAGDSYLNGAFVNKAVTVTKTGASKLTIGPGFSAPEGSTVNVNAGVLALDAGATAAQLSSCLTVASGVAYTGEGVFGAVDLMTNDVVVPDASTFTDKEATYPLLTATSFSGASANANALLATLNANERKGKWKLGILRNGNGTSILCIRYFKSGFTIVIR